MAEAIKKGLLESILEVFEEENYSQMCEEVKNAKDLFKNLIKFDTQTFIQCG